MRLETVHSLYHYPLESIAENITNQTKVNKATIKTPRMIRNNGLFTKFDINYSFLKFS